MKKFGFTLAEVLITLTIIGVVAALTTPSLISNVNNAKVGPSLAKAISTFQAANQAMLNAEEVSSITSVNEVGYGSGFSTDSYVRKLGRYMKITPPDYYSKFVNYSSYDGGHYHFPRSGHYWHQYACPSDDGLTYYIYDYGTKYQPHSAFENIPSNQLIGEVFVDINGAYSKPNKQAKDIFRFYLYNDGTVRPVGGRSANRHYAPQSSQWYHSCHEGYVHPPQADNCAGSIFENNFKVIYD